MRKMLGSLLLACGLAMGLAALAPVNPVEAAVMSSYTVAGRQCKGCTGRCGCSGFFWLADGVCSGPQWPPPYEHCNCLAIWGAEGVEVADGPGLYTKIEESPGFYPTVTIRNPEPLVYPDSAKLSRLAAYQRWLSDSVNAEAAREKLNRITATGLIDDVKK